MAPEEAHAVEHLLLELLQVQIDDWSHVEGDELRHHQPADHYEAECAPRGAVGSVAERDGQRADDRGHRGHDDRPEPIQARLVNRILCVAPRPIRCSAKSTIMMPFFFTMPISMNMPTYA